MKVISVFNNKGGVGKSTLTYHLGHSLAKLGHKVLMIDLDPQCNLTICTMEEEHLKEIRKKEDNYIDDFEKAFKENHNIINEPRSIHFILKPAEDWIGELSELPPTYRIGEKIDMIPWRLSLHTYENKIAERWNGIYQGDNLSIRTITNIRSICQRYAEKNGYEYVLIDTSPSLWVLNKVTISTVDWFFIPAQPDMFSLYGIKNIGHALETWKKDFDSIYKLISHEKRTKFPSNFVQFLGYTIYNAKKYTRQPSEDNEYGLAQAHYQYVKQIPSTIIEFIHEDNRASIPNDLIKTPIGRDAIMHSHNTFPAMAQALKCPMWEIPQTYAQLSGEAITRLKENGFEYNQGNNWKLAEIAKKYKEFTEDLLDRINRLWMN